MMQNHNSAGSAIDPTYVCPQLSDLVTVDVTTNNRWQDLRVTLKTLTETVLGQFPIDLFDEPCRIPGSSLPAQLNLRRFSDSLGLIVRRNQLASNVKTKYLLSLDDNSYPVSGSPQSTQPKFIRLSSA
jgi:hypothetical protein